MKTPVLLALGNIGGIFASVAFAAGAHGVLLAVFLVLALLNGLCLGVMVIASTEDW